ncbi:hypothetical protein BL253_35150 [Pseudofrankia asymbiotica]|uniref:Uncharacterized protein n=1 Tax=Pseudofrankia asymbiotica TaxID=1834516 RepID=A0A1V2I065_9ACTN|nr:hypothetical protein BL253_35150 [Pseudofrankia asymbiotica]
MEMDSICSRMFSFRSSSSSARSESVSGFSSLLPVPFAFFTQYPRLVSLIPRFFATSASVHSGVCRGRPLTLGFVLRGRAVIVA